MLFRFKRGVEASELGLVTANLFYLFAMFTQYSAIRGLPVTITCIKQHVSGRKYRTHAEGRAIDLSVKGWSDRDIAEVTDLFNEQYKDIAAISARDGVPRAVVVHKGTAKHFHLQVRPEGGLQ